MRNTINKTVVFGLGSLLMLGLASRSEAVIIFTPGPGNFPGDENVLFNTGSLIPTGPLVQGITNNTGFIVEFSEAGEDLTTPSGGQARVESLDDGYTALKLSFDDPNVGFQTLIWNLNASGPGNVTFTVGRTGGPDVVQAFTVDGSGQNFFRFEAVGESMVWVSLATDVDLQDVRQTRIGGAALMNVPEPATMIALGIGVAGLLRRRALRKA